MEPELKIEFKEGVFDDMSNEDYHNVKAWSKSSLDHINKSMMHFFYNKENPIESTESMEFGTAFHYALLQPELFEKKYFVIPKFDMRKTQDKIEYARLISENVGKTPITEDNKKTIDNMLNACNDHPNVLNCLKGGIAERSYFWVDQYSGLKLKSRPDLTNDTEGVFIELKTCQDASKRAFSSTIADRRYHVQAAMCIDGALYHTGNAYNHIILAVEVKPPYGIGLYNTRDCIELGRTSYQINLDTIKRYYKQLNRDGFAYAGYNPNIVNIALPSWAKISIQEFVNL